ncbi:hypothetical protein DRO55_03295, partial [Candidatus Bathyarchaeota archaeon]
MPKPAETPERLLILCVDRDNDIGKKAGVKTPVIGRKRNMNAAIKLIMRDPEEADANAMFEALRIYDDLKADAESGNLRQIATIAGSEVGGIAADRKLISELKEVLRKFPADGIILVTDGFSDEEVLPLIQSRVPVTSVRRVVVKHSESIEETAAVFSRYLKMLVEDPRYSKMVLGLPGILLIVWATLSFIGIFIPYDIGTWTWIAALFIVGTYLLFRGYRLDQKILKFYNWFVMSYSISELITGFSMITGLLLVGISLYQAWSYTAMYVIPYPSPSDLGQWLEVLPQILGNMIYKSLTLIILGVCFAISGRLIRYIIERDSRLWRTITILVTCAWSWEIFNEVSLI